MRLESKLKRLGVFPTTRVLLPQSKAWGGEWAQTSTIRTSGSSDSGAPRLTAELHVPTWY